MVFDVSTPAKMEQSVAGILSISEDTLRDIIRAFDIQAQSPEKDMMDFAVPFIQKHLTQNIESVYLYHLNRSIDEPKELFPLYKVLTTKNSFSDYLLSKDIAFDYSNKKIHIIYRGHNIPEISLYNPDSVRNEHSLLASRFGYFKTPDFCVNGFLHPIQPEKSTDGYYISLSFGPEIMGCLERFLKIDGLQSDYKRLSKYYYSAVLLPLDDMIFDNKESLTDPRDKTIEYLYSCIDFLSDWYNQYNLLSNRMIRVNDHTSLTIDHNLLLPEPWK